MGKDVRLRARNKQAGETTLVTYREGSEEKTHLVTFEKGDELGFCFVDVPVLVAQALLEGSLYERVDAQLAKGEPPRKGAVHPVEPSEEADKPKEEKVREGLDELASADVDIDDLTVLGGVGPTIAQRLKAAGFYTSRDIAGAHVNVLVQDCGLSETFAKKLVANANDLLS